MKSCGMLSNRIVWETNFKKTTDDEGDIESINFFNTYFKTLYLLRVSLLHPHVVIFMRIFINL